MSVTLREGRSGVGSGPALEKAGPVLENIGDVAEKAGKLVVSVNLLVDDARPKIAEISDEAVAIVKTGRDQVERVGELLQDAAGRARTPSGSDRPVAR